MSEAKLDQIVKGAPPPDLTPPSLPTTPINTNPTVAPTDPLASLPSSPPQIYLNLLILEASLRAQYLELRARRRQHTFFLTLLAAWLLYFAYALFLAPREDGNGTGGSVYWVVEVAEKVCLMGGAVTGILVWGTGQWERGIRWPRRWVGTTNRGLRGFNCKIVVVKGPWWRESCDTLRFFFSTGLFLNSGSSSYRVIDPAVLSGQETSTTRRSTHSQLPDIIEDGAAPAHEEDLSPGGDTISLLLLPKLFSPSFRENWDIYRTAYWEHENERRRLLLRRLTRHNSALRQQQSFWTRCRHPFSTPRDLEKTTHATHHQHPNQHKHLSVPASSSEKTHHSRRSNSQHSRSSSRSTTPTPTPDDEQLPPAPQPPSLKSRRNSTSSQASSNSNSNRLKAKRLSSPLRKDDTASESAPASS